MPLGRTALGSLPAVQLHLPGFEGPLELLLHLLDRGQVEITSLSLVSVADQYLDFLHLLPPEVQSLDFLAEFLVVASHLLLLKSRALLPREAARRDDEDELDELALEQRLIEYRRYREVADGLRRLHERGERTFQRQAPPPLPPAAPPPRLESAAPEQLARALQRLLATRAPEPPTAAPPRISLRERIVQVRDTVRRLRQVSFTQLAETCETRMDLIITFLAVLELYRAREFRLEQDELFGEIWLTRAATARPVAADGDDGRA